MSLTPEMEKVLEDAYNMMEVAERQMFSEAASQVNMPVLEFLYLIIKTGFEQDPQFLDKVVSSIEQSRDFLERLVVISIYHCENIQLT